jgi:hypothetical protein
VKHNRIPGILLLVITAIWPACSSAETDSHRQAVEKLFELTHMQQKIEVSVNNVLALQLQQSPALREHEELLTGFLEKNIGWAGMKDNLITMYMQAFTEQELNEINTFYSTPAGKKLIQRLPELIQERDRLAMQRMQENIGELQYEIEARQAKKQP